MEINHYIGGSLDPNERLISAIRDVLRQFKILIPSEPTATLDFSANQLIRHRRKRKVITLARDLPVRMLEELCRRGRMSVTTFLLLPRSKSGVVDGNSKRPGDVLRQKLVELNDMIGEWDLPIEIERCGQVIRAWISSDELYVNVTSAREFAKQGYMQLAAGDVRSACDLANKALSIDVDCCMAASLVARAMRIDESCCTEDIVMKSETCLARSMLRHATAVKRLKRANARMHPEAETGGKIAEKVLDRLDRYWRALGSWPFGGSPTEISGSEYRRAFRELADTLLQSVRGNSKDAYERFGQNSLVLDIVNSLLPDGVKERKERDRKVMIETLTIKVYSMLLLNGWSPSPANSKAEFQERTTAFLRARRIWRTLFNRSTGKVVTFREDLYEEDRDSEDEDQAVEEDAEDRLQAK